MLLGSTSNSKSHENTRESVVWILNQIFKGTNYSESELFM